MVSYTSSLLNAQSAGTQTHPSSVPVDRYRPVRSLTPVVGAVKGDLCPLAAVARMATSSTKSMITSPMGWQHRTTVHNSIVFGGFGFDQSTDDTRVGPLPPRRPPV